MFYLIEDKLFSHENKDLFTIAKNNESYTLAFISKNKIYNYQFSIFLNNASCKVKEINNFKILKKGLFSLLSVHCDLL